MAGSAFFTAASGLRNHQSRIDVIANNIANVNTAGYKGSSMIFSDVLSQTIRGASAPSGNYGGVNPKQVGLGMQIAAIHILMAQAALENTSRQTDFAVNGGGFFTLTNGSEEIYTRAGDFSLDRDGRLVNNSGFRVQGYNELTRDGRAIDPGSRIGDIIIEIGKKLEARASTQLDYKSNLDSSSFRYGSADNERANVGTTGILTFAGAAEPWTIAVGNPVTVGAGATTTINGVLVTWAAAATPQQQALDIAEAINMNTTLAPQMQATVRQDANGDYLIVLQAVNAGTTIDITTPDAASGLTAGIYSPPAGPGKFLVGDNAITVTDAKAATDTTTVPVGAGTGNRPLIGDTLIINGVTVTLSGTYVDANTAAQNAVLLANDINNTAGITVTATANPNGTLTLVHNYAGMQRQAAGVALPAYADADIYLDSSADPTVAARWGFTSLAGWDAVNDVGAIDNGVNAKAELVFTPDDGSPALTRYFEDWAYDRSVPSLPLPPAPPPNFLYDASTLNNVQNAIQGSGATFPLLPGVNVSIDTLAPGQAAFRTEDAAVHTTSRMVYDSLGNAHNLTTTFTHINENEWQYEVSLPEEPNIALTNTTGTITFSSQGLITSGNPTAKISFTAPGAEISTIQLIYDGNGDPIQGITQYASAMTTAARNQDGYRMGVLNDFETDQSGTIVASYDNGERRPIAQIMLSTFANPEGLSRVGDTAFESSTNSGQAVKLHPGTGGSGLIYNGFLEQANVDLSLEFTNMIITERGLQANSRVFTTQDEILNEIVNLKR